MLSAYEAANYLVYLIDGTCEDLTNMKINKLLYYAQGHYLQMYGTRLFGDAIEAWKHGPVVHEVYQRYMGCGEGAVHIIDERLIDNLSDQEKDFLLEIARTYGRYTAGALRNMTHVPKSPWDKVYAPGAYRAEIPVDSIRDYFDTSAKRLEKAEVDVSDDDIIGYRDENGTYVLPENWNDETLCR